MSQDSERPKLKIPEFHKDAETTWWVQGRDTKSRSARKKAARRHLIWVVFASSMLAIFGTIVLVSTIYGVMYLLRPVERDVFTPKAEITATFQTGHTAPIQDLIYTPDGLFLVTASDDSTCELLDAETGKVLRKLEGHQQGVTSLAAVSLLQEPTANQELALAALRILTGSRDVHAILWNPEMNPPIQQKLGESEDGLSSADFDLFELPPGHTKAISAVALSADGRYALTGSLDNRFLLWDARNHALVKTEGETESADGMGADLILPHNGPVLAVAFSPNGRTYASGSEDCLIKIWDSNSDRLLTTFTGHNSAILSLHYGSSGNLLLASSKDQRASLWNLLTGTRVQLFETENEVKDAEISKNERFVLTTMYENSAVLWDVKTARKLVQFEAPAQITALTMSPRETEDGIPLFIAAATVENKIVVFTTASNIPDIQKVTSSAK